MEGCSLEAPRNVLNARGIPSPSMNSPIGTVYSETEFEKIIERANEVDAIVVVDEAYHYFYPSTEIGLTKKYKNLVVLRTFSKLCSMAGLRIGYAAADAKIIEYIEKAESTFNVSNVSVLYIATYEDKEDYNHRGIGKEYSKSDSKKAAAYDMLCFIFNETPEQDSTWTCQYCGAENSSESNVCQTCFGEGD
mgnify:CR=1 FL=1